MPRHVLDESRLHPAIRERVAGHHADIVREVEQAVAANKVVVVGMKQNPVVKAARKQLKEEGIQFTYLEYGSYFSKWKERLAIKLWAGFPTFPMVFIDGTLVGGNAELTRLRADGKLKK